MLPKILCVRCVRKIMRMQSMLFGDVFQSRRCDGKGSNLDLLSMCLDYTFVCPRFFFLRFPFSFFFSKPQWLTKSSVNSAFVHYSRTHKLHFSATFSLKMGLTVLFTHLKIISQQCFQFQFSVLAKISSIQMDP